MKTLRYIVLPLLSLCLCGCSRSNGDEPEPDNTYDRVMILYSAGFNSLHKYLSDNINSLCDIKDDNNPQKVKAWLPSKSDKKALLVISHSTRDNISDYKTPTSPCVIRLYKDKKGNATRDTLLTMTPDMLLTKPEVMDSTLDFVRHNFKSEHYGMVVSSHGTGWLPRGYYEKGASIFSSVRKVQRMTELPYGAVPYTEENLPGPAVKSFGQELEYRNGVKISYEIELPELAESIPMHLDYLIFDVCLMGGVEVAYELRDKCSLIAFSQTEVLAQGVDYIRLAERLLSYPNPEVRDVCQDYFNLYLEQTGEYRSATISLVDCSQLEALASVCADIIEAHPLVRADSQAGKRLEESDVQGYYRFNHPWFFDLEDIFSKGGMTPQEADRLHAALESCIIYKANTPSFLGVPILVHSGLSMYLPSLGEPNLDDFYKTLAWNRAVRLVR